MSGPPLPIVRTVVELRERTRSWRAQGKTIGLAPTMGALHDGHLALVRRSLHETERTVVSLFVNPKQFGPGEDLDLYPRDEDTDRALLEKAGAHLLYAPRPEDVYGQGFASKVGIGGLAGVLEGEFRPGFFDGVATVVLKLLNRVQPDVAFFGEKDFQQLLVIKRMVRDLDLPVGVRGVETVREADGLALSSRNAYLGKKDRAIAPALYGTIKTMAEAVSSGADGAEQEAWAVESLLKAGFTSVDYVYLRSAETLGPYGIDGRPGRILAAARLGTTRLIDNVSVQ